MVEPLKEAATALKAQGTVVMAIDGQARRSAPHRPAAAAPPHARAAAIEPQRRSCSARALAMEL